MRRISAGRMNGCLRSWSNWPGKRTTAPWWHLAIGKKKIRVVPVSVPTRHHPAHTALKGPDGFDRPAHAARTEYHGYRVESQGCEQTDPCAASGTGQSG